MSIRASLLAGLVAISSAVAAPVFASDADVIREARDRAEIEKLMWDYARALDTGNADAYAAVYTPDGAFGETKGSDALKKMINDLNKSRDERKAKGEVVNATLHMTANHYMEFVDKDHVRLHNYYLTALLPPPAKPGEKAPEARAPIAGQGVDDLVRVNGKWLIKSRNVASSD